MRLIDADKLVDMLYDNEFAVLCPLDEVSGVVDACPTVDAVPAVHARWVDGKCSNCGADIPTDDAHDAIFESECHYCYSCGAKMEGEA